MKADLRTLLFAAAVLLPSSHAHAAVNIPLSNPLGGNSWSASEAVSPGALLSDGFAYNPDSPTAVSPNQQWFTDATRSTVFLATNNDAQNYWTASVVIPAGTTLAYLDVWGRSDYAGAEQSRHQDLVITLSDGVNSWSGAAWSGVSIATATPSSYGRFDFTGAGVTNNLLQTATSIRIDHSPGSSDFLLLAEVRAAGLVPEPSGALLVALGAALLTVRRRS